MSEFSVFYFRAEYEDFPNFSNTFFKVYGRTFMCFYKLYILNIFRSTPEAFSQCSIDDLETLLLDNVGHCLFNQPTMVHCKISSTKKQRNKAIDNLHVRLIFYLGKLCLYYVRKLLPFSAQKSGNNFHTYKYKHIQNLQTLQGYIFRIYFHNIS